MLMYLASTLEMNGSSSATFSSQGAAPVCQCQVKSVLPSIPVIYLIKMLMICPIFAAQNNFQQLNSSHILGKGCVLLQIPAMHIVEKKGGEKGGNLVGRGCPV